MRDIRDRCGSKDDKVGKVGLVVGKRVFVCVVMFFFFQAEDGIRDTEL